MKIFSDPDDDKFIEAVVTLVAEYVDEIGSPQTAGIGDKTAFGCHGEEFIKITVMTTYR